MSKYYDKKRSILPQFKVGDKVLLDNRNLQIKRPSRKLSHKMEGPFIIQKLVGPHAIKLKLPKIMKCYDVFHVSLLEPYHENQLTKHQLVRPELVQVEGDSDEEEYQVK